jgi:ribose transport system substrate-binding protein
MKPLSVFVSLITEDNDFQKEQAATVQAVAARLGVQIQIAYAGNDAVDQSQQIFKAIQSTGSRPDAILVEPVGTGMSQAAAAAVSAGIGWGVVNREVDYVPSLRRNAKAPIFSVWTDHEEVGKIQGAQFGALLPQGGGMLYIEGPSSGGVAKIRSGGMTSVLPRNITVKVLKGDWTEQSGYHTTKAWLSLSTSRQLNIRAIGSQNDAMAIGARRAFEEVSNDAARKEWLSLPFTGCDGVAKAGQEWVRRGLLRATVVTPPPMGLALEILVNAIRSGLQPLERTISRPSSYPPVDKLTANASAATSGQNR